MNNLLQNLVKVFLSAISRQFVDDISKVLSEVHFVQWNFMIRIWKTVYQKYCLILYVTGIQSLLFYKVWLLQLLYSILRAYCKSWLWYKLCKFSCRPALSFRKSFFVSSKKFPITNMKNILTMFVWEDLVSCIHILKFNWLLVGKVLNQ